MPKNHPFISKPVLYLYNAPLHLTFLHVTSTFKNCSVTQGLKGRGGRDVYHLRFQSVLAGTLQLGQALLISLFECSGDGLGNPPGTCH
jgi:hypothetical protein